MDKASSLPDEESIDPSPPETTTDGTSEEAETTRSTPVEKIRRQLNDLTTKTDELEQRVNEVDRYYIGRSQEVMRQFGTILRQEKATLWRLTFFVKNALELQAKNTAKKTDDALKRKVIYNALAKTEGETPPKKGIMIC